MGGTLVIVLSDLWPWPCDAHSNSGGCCRAWRYALRTGNGNGSVFECAGVSTGLRILAVVFLFIVQRVLWRRYAYAPAHSGGTGSTWRIVQRRPFRNTAVHGSTLPRS